MFKRILVPLDGSELSERVLPIAKSLAQAYGAEIVLAHVVERGAVAPVGAADVSVGAGAAVQSWEQVVESERRDAEEYLGQLVNEMTAAGLKASREVVVGEAASGLKSLAESLPADLIVIATHGRSGIGRTVLGSIADTLIRESERPVLSIRG